MIRVVTHAAPKKLNRGPQYNTVLLLVIAAGTFVSTLVGGLLALRLRDRLHLILGFSAGAVIGVAFFDLLPEAIQLAPGAPETTTRSEGRRAGKERRCRRSPYH